MPDNHNTIYIGPSDSESWFFLAIGLAIIAGAIATAWTKSNESHDRTSLELARIERGIKP